MSHGPHKRKFPDPDEIRKQIDAISSDIKVHVSRETKDRERALRLRDLRVKDYSPQICVSCGESFIPRKCMVEKGKKDPFCSQACLNAGYELYYC
jgi:hypothetical protein